MVETVDEFRAIVLIVWGRHDRQSTHIAIAAIAARLYVVAPRTEVLATATFEINRFASRAWPWSTHHGAPG